MGVPPLVAVAGLFPWSRYAQVLVPLLSLDVSAFVFALGVLPHCLVRVHFVPVAAALPVLAAAALVVVPKAVLG